jgi:hypothetical protein
MLGLDLFSGIGGLTEALDGYVQPIAYCENDRHAQAVLLSRMWDRSLPRAPIWDDVRTLHARHLPVLPDIVYGGFPCQDISLAGRGAGLDGERSVLFFEIVRLVGELRPRFVFLENVPALTSRGGYELLLSLPAWGMTVAGEFYPLQMWERITSENDGGFWRTPDTCGGGTSGQLRAGKTHRKSGAAITMRLADQVNNPKMWPTPCANKLSGSTRADFSISLPEAAKMFPTPRAAERNSYQQKGDRSWLTLTGVAKKWPTPTATEGKHGGPGRRYGNGDITLSAAAHRWPTPLSSEGSGGSQPPEKRKAGGHTPKLRDEVGGSLNPTWVEWLMGYPCGWTVLEDWAMQWYRPKRGKRLKG